MGSATESECDFLIVGSGIFGASTAYHLSYTIQDASRITVVDRAQVSSPQAASSDLNKIVRADYSKKFYMDLAFEAMEAWSEWSFLRSFYHRSGWVMLDERGSDLASRIRRNFREAGRSDPSKDISLDEVKTYWNGVLQDIDTSDFETAYTNPSAGWADASWAVEAMMKEAISKGVRYEVGEVIGLMANRESLQGIQTSDGRIFRGKKILLATGAWTPWLMASFEKDLKIEAENSIRKQIFAAGICTAAFKLSELEAKYYSQMPVLIYGEKGEVIPPNREHLLKFTNANTFTNFQIHPTGETISVPRKNQAEVPLKLKQQSIELVRKRIPKILGDDREPEWRLCWDVVSPDQSQLICQHPDPRLPNLYFATAGSFHSWKFLPVIGKYVVNVLQGKSNGKEKDEEWKWKTKWNNRGAHEKVRPQVDLVEFEQ